MIGSVPGMDNQCRSFKNFSFRDYDNSYGEVIKLRSLVGEAECGDNEYALLYEIAKGYHHHKSETKGYVVELGTRAGAGAFMMMTAVREAGRLLPVFTVDSYYLPVDYSYIQETREVFYENEVSDYICQIICSDLQFLAWYNQPIRLAFIDSSHSYEHTRDEIRMVMPLIVDDGWLVFHDYINPFGVVPAVNEFLDNQTEYDLDVYTPLLYGSLSIICFHVKGRKI